MELNPVGYTNTLHCQVKHFSSHVHSSAKNPLTSASVHKLLYVPLPLTYSVVHSNGNPNYGQNHLLFFHSSNRRRSERGF